MSTTQSSFRRFYLHTCKTQVDANLYGCHSFNAMWRFFWLLFLLPLADVESKNDWVLIKPQIENDWVPIKPHQGREVNRHVENPTNFCSCKKYPAFPNLCHCQKYGMKVCIFTCYLAHYGRFWEILSQNWCMNFHILNFIRIF